MLGSTDREGIIVVNRAWRRGKSLETFENLGG